MATLLYTKQDYYNPVLYKGLGILADQLNESKEFLFTPNQAWKSKFYQAVRKAARELGIKISGLHRLRSNYAQAKYLSLRIKGKADREARQEVSHNLGHNRIDVTKGYVPVP